MRHKHSFTLPAALLFGTLCSCSDDETELLPTGSQPAPIQVMVVFPPGELGDQGYSDNILRGVQQISTTDATTGQPRADVEFCSFEDAAATAQAIRTWESRRDNPFFANRSYERRLLVLTSPTILQYLQPDSLQADDDILLLDTPVSVLSQPAYAPIADRLHVLNISAAAATHRYCDLLDNWSTALEEESYRKVSLLRWFGDMDYPDSVDVVLEQRFGGYRPKVIDSLENEWAIDWRSLTANAVGYFQASDMNTQFEENDEYACIVNLGPGNAGFDTYLLNHNANITTLMLDSESSLSRNRYAITRQFGPALREWVDTWISQEEGASLPRITWHGGWDGYCTTDIPDSDFFTE